MSEGGAQLVMQRLADLAISSSSPSHDDTGGTEVNIEMTEPITLPASAMTSDEGGAVAEQAAPSAESSPPQVPETESSSPLADSTPLPAPAASEDGITRPRAHAHHHHHHHRHHTHHHEHRSHHRSLTLQRPLSTSSTLSAGAAAAAAGSTLDPHQSLLAQASRSELVELNASLLQELQVYDLLARELGDELEASLEHASRLQAEARETHTTAESALIALEVLRSERRRDAAKQEQERASRWQERAALKRQASRLKQALRSAGLNPHTILTGKGPPLPMPVSPTHSPEHRIFVGDAGGGFSIAEEEDPESVASESSKPDMRRKRSRPNRAMRARSEMALHINCDATAVEVDGSSSSSDSGESDEDAAASDDERQERKSDDDDDEEEEEKKDRDSYPPIDPQRLSQSVDGLSPLLGPLDSPASPAPLPPASPSSRAAAAASSPSAHPFLHLGLLDSSAPVSASEYLALQDSHASALERVSELEQKLLAQQSHWLTYLDLVQSRYRAGLQQRRSDVATQTEMVLNTPSAATIGAFADERLVFVTPNIWRAVSKAVDKAANARHKDKETTRNESDTKAQLANEQSNTHAASRGTSMRIEDEPVETINRVITPRATPEAAVDSLASHNPSSETPAAITTPPPPPLEFDPFDIPHPTLSLSSSPAQSPGRSVAAERLALAAHTALSRFPLPPRPSPEEASPSVSSRSLRTREETYADASDDDDDEEEEDPLANEFALPADDNPSLSSPDLALAIVDDAPSDAFSSESATVLVDKSPHEKHASEETPHFHDQPAAAGDLPDTPSSARHT